MGSSTFPSRPFQLRDYVGLVKQDIATNRSLIAWQVWVDKLSYSPTSSGGTADRQYFLAGIKVGENLGSGFDFTGAGPWLILEGQNWIDHLADGTQSIPVKAAASYDILGYTEVNYTLNLPTIPRASTPTFVGGAAFDAGSAVTINTNRASSSFTHDVTFSFGDVDGIIGTGVGASVAWTPPLSLLQEIPNATSGTGVLTVVTKSGATVIGSKSISFTLRAGVSVVPTISSLTVSDDNPTVASLVGAFVQGLSILKATVDAAGVQGSTIKSRSFKMGGTTAASGGVIPITASGTVPVTASATDSRARTAAWSGSISVLPYAQPRPTSVNVRRCDAGGTLNENGISLRVDLNCAVQSLINGTQRNSLTIKVFTRPYGTTTWTARNVINVAAGTVTYNSNFVISGGANYPIDDSFEVRVEISDKFKTAAAQQVVPTAAIFMHWSKTGAGFGKFWEGLATWEFAGTIMQDGSLVVDQGDAATNAETQAGSLTSKFVTPASLAARTATTGRTGVVELATDAETQAGTDSARAVTPASLGSGWTALPLASGWAVESGFTAPMYRVMGGQIEITPTILVRTSTLAVAAGTLYTVATLPTGSRPSAGVGSAGAIGVAGTLGACQWRINTTGTLQFSPYVASGTIATGGGVQNSVILPTIKAPI
ncbi:DUF859 family phage minor structural protein [Microbacterium sp. NPDC058389]|uniref:DUF859 family phage minor structural protein n=1 Tax=Microbacterium sp. NPDC058389 TaxID=3346475 RepID=UPI00365B2170